MLKVRLMGTKNDIKGGGKILQRNPKIEVTEFSDVYSNKGTVTSERKRNGRTCKECINKASGYDW